MPATGPTACLALADGTLFFGKGIGAVGQTTAELCFNTARTGYQEIMTDPSYAGQIVTFTFPHVGNVGTTPKMTKPPCGGRRHGGEMVSDRAFELARVPRIWRLAAAAPGPNRDRRNRHAAADAGHPATGRAPMWPWPITRRAIR